MKIFNWVNRKFHRSNNIVRSSIHKGVDELYGDQTTMMEKVGVDTQALVGQVALVEMLGGWKDGILTIGTLGFDDPLKCFHFNYNEIEQVREEDEDEDEDEDDHEERENDEEGENYPLVMRTLRDSLKEEVMDCEREKGKKNGGRTTLADLLSADYDDDVKRKHDDAPSEVLPKSKSSSGHGGKKQALRSTKNGISFAKKLIPRVGDDSRPIKKLNQLMTKMLKRKIHPELEGMIPTSDSQIKPNEEVSLLHTQDAVI